MARGLLDASGRLRLDAVPVGPDLTAALCEFLFGPIRTVVHDATLPSGSTLHPVSGYRVTATAKLVLCAYGTANSPLLALQVSDGPDEWGPEGGPVILTDGTIQGVFSYAPDYSGARLPDEPATVWLRAAMARVAR